MKEIALEKEEYVEGNKFSFGEHLEELRTRIIFCVISIIVCFGFCWLFKSTFLHLAERPHLLAMKKFGLTTDLQVISYQEGFYAYIKLCFISALFFAYPFIAYQVWKFVSPGLYVKERRYSFLFVFVSFLAFVVGILFGYFFLIPIGLQFLIGILGNGIAPIITMGQYISFVFLLTIALGLVFQLPLVILLITKIGIITADQFASWRKYAILGTFIISAIITPPDPFTQVMTAIPMIALYETGILIARPTRRRLFYFGSMVGGGSLLIFVFFLVFTKISSLAEISNINGDVKLAVTENGRYVATVDQNSLENNIAIKRGMCFTTGEGGKVSFNMKSGVSVVLDKYTEVWIVDKKAINIVKGQVYLNQPKIKTDFTVITPNGNVLINYGEVNIEVLPSETVVTVADGKALLTNGDIKETVLKGRQGSIVMGGNVVNVGDIIDWVR